MGNRYNISITPGSNLRTDALIHLAEGKKPLDALRTDLNVSSTTLLHTLRELEEYKLIFEDAERNYALTNNGKIVTRNLIAFNDTIETLHTYESFWLTYDLSPIPDYLLDKIGWLKDSYIISGTPANVLNAYSTVVKLLQDAKKIMVVSSILVPDVTLLFDTFATEKDMRVILTEEVLHPSIEAVGQERIRQVLKENVKLYIVRQNPKIGVFTVTDYFISLGLYRLGGTFDFSSHLMSCSKTAIDWGLALFDHYAERAERVDLS
ncbi:MAG TPA: transcriptional regulator FilR1 domain-containing protein [Candidatus Acidoferrales bacterium]|nr:transcriptional regulator FilR1 domain-containing protein [Candidatus Acidoferrales bacterium]